MSAALEKDLFRRFTLLETWLPPGLWAFVKEMGRPRPIET